MREAGPPGASGRDPGPSVDPHEGRGSPVHLERAPFWALFTGKGRRFAHVHEKGHSKLMKPTLKMSLSILSLLSLTWLAFVPAGAASGEQADRRAHLDRCHGTRNRRKDTQCG